MSERPLSGVTVVERTATAAGAYAGRLLAVLGADVILVEPPEGHELRRTGTRLPGTEVSSVFAYLAAGKASVVCDLDTEDGREDVGALVASAQVYLDDFDAPGRASARLDPATLRRRFPALVYTSVRPFGLVGPKAGWTGEELTLFHASGEGNLLPNGLAYETDPHRGPLKIAGNFAGYQGGLAATLGTLAALWASRGTLVDAAVQDAAVAVGAFAIQRFGDGSHETRASRSFRYGGVLECSDGYVELLTLEDRQWAALLELVDRPDWAQDDALRDNVGRSQDGPRINEFLRRWARDRSADELVEHAQRLGVPAAKYARPVEILTGAHESARRLFAPVHVPGIGDLLMPGAPFRFGIEPLTPPAWVADPGRDQARLRSARGASAGADR